MEEKQHTIPVKVYVLQNEHGDVLFIHNRKERIEEYVIAIENNKGKSHTYYWTIQDYNAYLEVK